MDLSSPAATKVIGAISLLVVAAAGWTLVVGPETSALSDRREAIETTRDQNTQLAAQVAVLEKQREELGATRRAAAALAEKFPPTADQPGVFEEVTAAAVEAGIGADGVTALVPTPPMIGATSDPAAPAAATTATPTGGLLARQTVTVSVTGTYDQTQRLLENLENMRRAYLVSTVSVAGDPETGTYTTTVGGDMFVMPPVADPGKLQNSASTAQPEG